MHALKIFDMRLVQVSYKEIEALKSLKHDNIVKFVKEDREVSYLLRASNKTRSRIRKLKIV